MVKSVARVAKAHCLTLSPRSRIGNSILETYMGLRSFGPRDSALGCNDANMFLHIPCTSDIKGVKRPYRYRD